MTPPSRSDPASPEIMVPAAPTSEPAELDLQTYFPYRLAVLAENVSLAVAEIYQRRHGLTRQEWRVVAALGGRDDIAARDLGALITLDKMQVSRALQGLEHRGLIARAAQAGDRRRHRVWLTPEGRSLYREIVPAALLREREILSGLTQQETVALVAAMELILVAARNLQQPHEEPPEPKDL